MTLPHILCPRPGGQNIPITIKATAWQLKGFVIELNTYFYLECLALPRGARGIRGTSSVPLDPKASCPFGAARFAFGELPRLKSKI